MDWGSHGCAADVWLGHGHGGLGQWGGLGQGKKGEGCGGCVFGVVGGLVAGRVGGGGSLLDELHRLSVHGEGRLGLLGTLLQSVPTLDERHHGVQVVHGLLEPVQLRTDGRAHSETTAC